MNMCSTFRSAILCNSLNIWKAIFDNVWGASLIRCHIQNTKACFDWKNSLLHVYNFQFENEALWLFVVWENGKWKKREEGKGAWHPTADTLEERRHYQTVFLGGMSTRLNGSINQTQSAVWHTFTHISTRVHAHNTRQNPTHGSQPTPFPAKH